MADYKFSTKIQAYLAKIAGKEVTNLPKPSSKTQELLKDIADGYTALPAIGDNDNGKVLGVSSKKYKLIEVPTELPTIGNNDNGKVLGVDSSAYALINVPSVVPAMPIEDGTYTLKVTVDSGAASVAWVADVP